MRKALLTLALAGLITIPVAAQFRPGMGRGMGGNPLANMSVQAELKFTDAQKKEAAEIQKTSQTAMREAFGLFREDKEKAQEQMKKAAQTSTKAYKKLRDGLTSEQKTRLGEIEVQLLVKDKNLDLFKNADAVKALKLTSKQKEELKEAMTDIEKDSKEILEDAKGDFRKRFAAQTKINKMRGEAFDKVVKSLDADQTKALKTAEGKSFDYKPDFGGGRPGGGKKGGKKKDDA